MCERFVRRFPHIGGASPAMNDEKHVILEMLCDPEILNERPLKDLTKAQLIILAQNCCYEMSPSVARGRKCDMVDCLRNYFKESIENIEDDIIEDIFSVLSVHKLSHGDLCHALFKYDEFYVDRISKVNDHYQNRICESELIKSDKYLVKGKRKPQGRSTKEFAISIDGVNDRIRCNNLHKKFSGVMKKHNGVDLYTQSSISSYQSCKEITEIDHVVECQLVAASIVQTRNFSNQRNFDDILKIINDFDNLNITTLGINRSKGASVKSFISQLGKPSPEPLRNFLFRDVKGREKVVSKYVDSIQKAMDTSYDYIIREFQPSGNNVISVTIVEEFKDQLESDRRAVLGIEMARRR